MATIGRIAVDLVSRTAQFKRDMKQARGTVTRFTSTLNTGLVKLTQFGTVAGGIGIAGLTKLTKDSFTAIATTEQWSKRLGINVRMLSEYGHAAKVAGLESEDLFDALKDLTEKAGLARFGEQGEIEKFEKLGLSMKELNQLSNADLFSAVADKIAAIKDPAQQTAVAMELMGDNGFKMLNILKDGGEGLRKTSAEAKRLGLSFDAIDANQIRLANESVNRLWGVVEGLGRTLAIQVAPLVSTLADDFTKMGMSGEGSFNAVTDAIKPAAKVVAFFAEGVEMVKIAYTGVKLASMEFMQTVMKYTPIGAVDSLTESIKKTKAEFNELLTKKSPLEKVENFFADVKANADKAAKALKELNKQNTAPQLPIVSGLQSAFEGTVNGISGKVKSAFSGAASIANGITQSTTQGLLDSRIAMIDSQIESLNGNQSGFAPSDNRAAVGVGEIFSSIQQQIRGDRESKRQREQLEKIERLEQEKKEIQKQMLAALQKQTTLDVVTI